MLYKITKRCKTKIIMNKTTSKNKSEYSLNMPAMPYYSIQDIFDLNAGIKVTVRLEHTKMVDSGKVVCIGTLTGGKGRPPKAYALTPVTKLTIDKAKADQINLIDYADRLINVIDVSVKKTALLVNMREPVMNN